MLRIVTLCVLANVLVLPAAAEPPRTQSSLTGDETDFLRESARIFAGCKRDSTPDYCTPYRTLIAHLAAPASANETIAAVNDADLKLKTDVSAAKPDASVIVNGHVSAPTSTIIPSTGGGVNVSLAAQSDTKTASISLDIDLGAGQPNTKNNVTTTTSRSLSIIGQAPVGQEQTFQNLATLDGLTKATSIGFQYNLIHVGMRNRSMVVNDPAYETHCQRLLDEAISSDPKLKESTKEYFKPYSCHAGTIYDIVKDDTNIPQAARDSLTTALEALDKQDTPEVRSAWLVGLSGKIGYEQHTFYDGQTLAKGTVSKYPFQLGVDGTYLFNDRTSLTLSYAFQHAYKDADSGETQTLCPPTGNPNLKCITGYIGEPAIESKHLLTADLRYISPRGLLPIPIGVNPTATYDVKSGAYGFQLPIYIVADSSKYLTGGIRYDWTSEKKKSVIGLFVSSAFCVFPGKNSCESSGDSSGK